MSNNRRQFTAAFKAKIALEALKEIKTVSQIAPEPGYPMEAGPAHADALAL